MVLRRSALCALFAGFAVYGLAHAPQVAADYPGGGNNYPGAGWHPLIPPMVPYIAGTPGNDPLNNPNIFYTYDWTHLYDIDPSGQRSQYHAGSEGGLPAPGSQNPDGGRNGGFNSYTINSPATSQSTIKFGWYPPNNDIVNFPMPPLFVLGSITPTASLYYTAGGDVNPTGTGYISDGWGWGPVQIELPSINNPSSVSDGVHRKVLPATVESPTQANPYVQSITMSPSGHVALSLQAPGYGQTAGTAAGFLGMPEYAYPITLGAPLPFGRPDLGDGWNQYVYDTEPNGELDIASQSLLSGASLADTRWMVVDPTTPFGDLEVVPEIFGRQPDQWLPYSECLIPRPITPTRIVTNSLSFVGLPQYVNGFGDHAAVMMVYNNNQYSSSELAHIQTFFDGANMTSNWPGADGRPDWFYYYNQIYPYNQFDYKGTTYNLQPPPGTIGGYGPVLAQVGAATAIDTFPPAAISQDPDNWKLGVVLGPNSLNSVDLPVFVISNAKKITNIGVMKVKGINTYERVCAHEQAHVKLWLGCKDQTGIFAFPPFTDPRYPGNHPYPWIKNGTFDQIVDTDGDGIPDDVETQYGLDPQKSDSTGYFTENGRVDGNTTGDVECLCEIAALGEVIKHKGDCMVDWSDQGLQYGAHPLFYSGPPGVFYPYKFIPTNSAYPFPAIDPPQSALRSWDQIISDIAAK